MNNNNKYKHLLVRQSLWAATALAFILSVMAMESNCREQLLSPGANTTFLIQAEVEYLGRKPQLEDVRLEVYLKPPLEGEETTLIVIQRGKKDVKSANLTLEVNGEEIKQKVITVFGLSQGRAVMSQSRDDRRMLFLAFQKSPKGLGGLLEVQVVARITLIV